MRSVDETHHLDHGWNGRHVPHTVPLRGLDVLDELDDVHAFDDFTENGIAERPRVYAFVVEVAIVPCIDEELRGRRVDAACPGSPSCS